MSNIYTANVKSVRAECGVSDQGHPLTGDEYVVGLRHPPFISPNGSADRIAHDVKPPKSLVQDWNREVTEMSIPETWDSIDYEERYIDFLDSDDDASNEIFRINMLSNKGDLCLVCGCPRVMYPYCIRKILYEYLSEK